MARAYTKENLGSIVAMKRRNLIVLCGGMCAACFACCIFSVTYYLSPAGLTLFAGLLPGLSIFVMLTAIAEHRWIEAERRKESTARGGKPVLGLPPDRNAFDKALAETRENGKIMLDRYLVGFEIDSGQPIWVNDDDLCGHGAVFAKTGVGKTLWLEGLMFQQMARGRASGFTFIDAKRDPGTLADIIMMALITGRIEDLIVIDPFEPVCAYNFVFTTQRADVKARKVLRCGLPPTSDQSTTKHYDRLAADAVYRVVRAMESLGLAWNVKDIAVALSAFPIAYPRIRSLLHEHGSKQAMVELGHLASTYRTAKGSLDSARLTDNLRGIASELHSISNSEAGEMFCTPRADLSLTDSILRGKLIYYMLPRLEEAESAARMVKVFREDLEVSIGEITSNRHYRLEDPHMVIIDEGASTFGPTWANLFELARKGRFALLFGAQSVGGLMDQAMGLSEEFYERVMANVNLKVIMRVGDNRTAMDMSEWIGKVTTSKKSFGTALSTSIAARELTKNIEINRRSSDSFRDAITVSEDEDDLVSPEELKHEMSAEKGLAWFDKGDGILRKGRAIWFDSDLPSTWEGREFLTRYESVEADEIGLAEWVDEHILSIETAESERKIRRPDSGVSIAASVLAKPALPPGTSPEASVTSAAPGSPYRLNIIKAFRGRTRSRTTMAEMQDEPEPQPAIPQPVHAQTFASSAEPKKAPSATHAAADSHSRATVQPSEQRPAVKAEQPQKVEAQRREEPVNEQPSATRTNQPGGQRQEARQEQRHDQKKQHGHQQHPQKNQGKAGGKPGLNFKPSGPKPGPGGPAGGKNKDEKSSKGGLFLQGSSKDTVTTVKKDVG